MSSETPSGPPVENPPEPFARGRIVWSRPPRPVFRVGPLPRVAPSLAARPVRRSGAGILTGSMIPPARAASPAAGVLPEASVEPVVEAVAPQPEPDAPEPVVEAVAPEPEPVVAGFEPWAEPVQAAPGPTPAPQETIVEPEAPEPVVTVPPPLSTEAKPAAKPRELPSVVVTPAIYATVGAAIEKVKKTDLWLIVAAIAAVLVTGGFIWLATLPAPQPVAPGPTPLVADAAPPAATTVVEEPPPEIETAAPVRVTSAPAPARAAPAAAAPVTAQPRRPTRAAPVVGVPPAPVETAPRPYIQTAPLIVEPPTPAAPAPADPDAPVSTAPQPLN